MVVGMEGGKLIVCYGNPMRGDDGVGLEVGRLLSERLAGRDDVRVVLSHQLDVTIAAELAEAATAVFVDAQQFDQAAAPTAEPVIAPVSGSASQALRANVHAVTPDDLVALALRLYGRAAESFLVAVPAFEMEHADTLTGPALEAARQAEAAVLDLLGEGSGGSDPGAPSAQD
jgi:hydrogenase maturation protease